MFRLNPPASEVGRYKENPGGDGEARVERDDVMWMSQVG
jgi:hypothetical protein